MCSVTVLNRGRNNRPVRYQQRQIRSFSDRTTNHIVLRHTCEKLQTFQTNQRSLDVSIDTRQTPNENDALIRNYLQIRHADEAGRRDDR